MRENSRYRRPLYFVNPKCREGFTGLDTCDQCSLGKSHVGIVFSFAHSEDEKKLRMDQIVDTMESLLGLGFETIPKGDVSRFFNRIDESYAGLKDPVNHHFDLAIPLRKIDDFNNIFKWDHDEHRWTLITSSGAELSGNNFMIFMNDAIKAEEYRKSKVKPPTFVKIKRRRRIVRSATTAA